MAKLGKWIIGGLGWALTGPIGGLLGFILGSYIDSMSEGLVIKGPIKTQSGDFGVSLLILAAAVMKADGRVMRSELDYIKQFFIRQFGEEATKERIQLLQEILQQEIPVNDVCSQINQYMDYSSRLQLLHFLWGIAGADGQYHTTEINVILKIANWLGVSPGDSESIRAMFIKDTESAYKVLEIESSASDDDVKKAFRRMALKYHPDRVDHLGEEYQLDAKEKFQQVNSAYEAIRKERGMN